MRKKYFRQNNVQSIYLNELDTVVNPYFSTTLKLEAQNSCLQETDSESSNHALSSTKQDSICQPITSKKTGDTDSHDDTFETPNLSPATEENVSKALKKVEIYHPDKNILKNHL